MDRREGMGWKATPQRMAILEYLAGNKEHPSADDVYRAVSRRFPTMSVATVYNTLEALRRRGEVLELTIDPVKKRFDPGTAPHHHLICVECKRIVDVRVDYDLVVPEAQREDFEITGNHVEFYGRCSACRTK